MKILIKQITEVERDVELPLFFKGESKIVAFYENMQISSFKLGDHVSICKSEIYGHDLTTSLNRYEKISEEDFLETYNNHLEELKNCAPQLV